MGIYSGIDFRGTDEHSGCFLIRRLDKADQPLGINRMGTAVGFCSLRSCLAFYRTGKCGCTLAGGQ